MFFPWPVNGAVFFSSSGESLEEVCQRSFPLQFQKLAPEGRTLAVKPSCLRTKEDALGARRSARG